MESTGHAKLAPSAASRWIACPGSIAASARWPDEETAAAAEGTFAHDIAARCLESCSPAVCLLGATDGVHVVDKDMAAHLQTYLDVVDSLGGVRMVEQKVRLVGLREDIEGTADAVLYEDGVLHVVDLKYGAGVFVAVEDNPQLKIYALGCLLEIAPREHWGVDWVTIHIVQPRHHQGPAHRSVDIDTRELLAWGKDILIPAAAKTEEEDAAFQAGDHCRFCPAKPGCPELRETSLARAQHLFEGETLEPKTEGLPPVDMMDPVEIASCLGAFATIETWIKAVREHAYTEAARGVEIPGYKIVDKKSNRAWKDADTTQAILEAYIDEDDIFAKRKLVSPAQAEKLLPKDQRSIVESLAHKPPSGTVLVPESDKRPRHDGAAVFDELL